MVAPSATTDVAHARSSVQGTWRGVERIFVRLTARRMLNIDGRRQRWLCNIATVTVEISPHVGYW
jgi:hypothetical protein